jgi:hypothetical protein
MASFKLEKIYFDCIDEEGNCFIVYWANLSISWMKFRYAGLIFSDLKGSITERSSIAKIRRPETIAFLEYNFPPFHLLGKWQRIEAPIIEHLYKDSQGNELIWDCHHPKATVEINYRDKVFHGLGYAETLSLNTKPWQLPLDELRWGRFLSENDTIIWIQWKGAHPVNKLFHNGKIYEDASFEEKRLSFNCGKCCVDFDKPSLLRKGKLGGILIRFPLLKLLVNKKILSSVELKYKAQSVFKDAAGMRYRGWSLYEIVTWNK